MNRTSEMSVFFILNFKKRNLGKSGTFSEMTCTFSIARMAWKAGMTVECSVAVCWL